MHSVFLSCDCVCVPLTTFWLASAWQVIGLLQSGVIITVTLINLLFNLARAKVFVVFQLIIDILLRVRLLRIAAMSKKCAWICKNLKQRRKFSMVCRYRGLRPVSNNYFQYLDNFKSSFANNKVNELGFHLHLLELMLTNV